MQASCPESIPSLPRWATRLKRRSLVSCERARRTSLSNVKRKVCSKVPAVATKLSLRTCTVYLCALMMALMLLVAVQFAGLGEKQYELDRRETELAALNHQQTELQLQIEQLSALQRIESEAKRLGMGFPAGVRVLQLADSQHKSSTSVAFAGYR